MAGDDTVSWYAVYASQIYDTGLNRYTGIDIGQRFERVEFDNGTVWDLTQGLPATGSEVDESFVGTSQDDTLSGGGGYDTRGRTSIDRGGEVNARNLRAAIRAMACR